MRPEFERRKRQILRPSASLGDSASACSWFRLSEAEGRVEVLVGMDTKHTTKHQCVSLLVCMKKWRGPRGAKLISLN